MPAPAEDPIGCAPSNLPEMKRDSLGEADWGGWSISGRRRGEYRREEEERRQGMKNRRRARVSHLVKHSSLPETPAHSPCNSFLPSILSFSPSLVSPLCAFSQNYRSAIRVWAAIVHRHAKHGKNKSSGGDEQSSTAAEQGGWPELQDGVESKAGGAGIAWGHMVGGLPILFYG